MSTKNDCYLATINNYRGTFSKCRYDMAIKGVKGGTVRGWVEDFSEPYKPFQNRFFVTLKQIRISSH